MAKNERPCLWVVFAALIVLFVSQQSSLVDGRALRQETAHIPRVDKVAGCGEEDRNASGSNSQIGMASFAVSANNDTGRSSVIRSLAYKLASGPSRRGPGH